MQPLSETWAAAYVQILTMLIIFALGIPALAIQLVVQDDIRTVFQRRSKWTLWVILVLVILGAFISFIWILHPPFNKASKDPAINVPVTVRRSATGQETPVENFTLSVGQAQSDNTGINDSMTSMASPVAGALMTLILIALLVIGSGYTRQFRRSHIISELEDDLIEDFKERTLLQRLRRWAGYILNIAIKKKPAKKRRSRKKRSAPEDSADQKCPPHRLDKDTLYDLIFLGRGGKAGKDKTMVLDALERIATLVQTSSTYQGDELEELIRGLKGILLNGEQPGNDDNFNQAVDIIKHIRYELSQKDETSKYIDAGLANTVLEELGVEAIKSKSGQIAERFLEEASFSSKIVFEMGLIALYNKQFHTAILALNKLETLAEAQRLAACSATFDLLGMLAHFTFNGTASRMRADSFLSNSISDFSPSIDYCLFEAYAHHYENSNFDTADMVFQLRQQITTKCWSPLLLPPTATQDQYS
ncbi:MAG: hypothetical protein QOF02_144 [Blastocatellia bacterium]|nr:hypothetical protein [Blastocatellia bacterium]